MKQILGTTDLMTQNDATESGRRLFLRRIAAASAVGAGTLAAGPVASASDRDDDDRRQGPDHGEGARWTTTWCASAHGLFPLGTAVSQPDLSFAFPDPTTGANNQSFRLIVRPTIWGEHFRLRFSNFFGSQAVAFDGVYLGLQASAGVVVKDSNRRVTFTGSRQVSIAPGQRVWSDPVHLDALRGPGSELLQGRKLAVSFQVVGTSGPMTWHSKAVQTSYLSAPGAGSHGGDQSDSAFPYSTASWYFLDAVDTAGSRDAATVVALGDSITDGTASTLNGDDRWPDVLTRRLHAAFGNRIAVANAGVGGNRIVSDSPNGGPSAISRLERDVLSLSDVSAVIWLEGINDLRAGTTAEAVIDGIKAGVAYLRQRRPGIRIVQATITSDKGNATTTAAVQAARQAVNAFIRTAKIFDAVVDFDAVTVDPASGELRPEFLPNSTTAGIDHLHPNRAGYQAMGNAVDIRLLGQWLLAERR